MTQIKVERERKEVPTVEIYKLFTALTFNRITTHPSLGGDLPAAAVDQYKMILNTHARV